LAWQHLRRSGIPESARLRLVIDGMGATPPLDYFLRIEGPTVITVGFPLNLFPARAPPQGLGEIVFGGRCRSSYRGCRTSERGSLPEFRLCGHGAGGRMLAFAAAVIEKVSRGKRFGNGRTVRNMWDECLARQANRLTARDKCGKNDPRG
jgi:hypothetical protein